MKGKDLVNKWWFWLIIIALLYGLYRWSKRGFTIGYIPLLGLGRKSKYNSKDEFVEECLKKCYDEAYKGGVVYVADPCISEKLKCEKQWEDRNTNADNITSNSPANEISQMRPYIVIKGDNGYYEENGILYQLREKKGSEVGMILNGIIKDKKFYHRNAGIQTGKFLEVVAKNYPGQPTSYVYLPASTVQPYNATGSAS